MRWFFLLLPWLELFTLIQLGVATSALFALFYVLATFLLGLSMLRRQGLSMAERFQGLQQGSVLGQQLMVDDMALGLAGLLLMVPGVTTDVVALVVLIAPLRRRLGRWLAGPQAEPYVPQRDREHAAEDIIEGQYRRLDD